MILVSSRTWESAERFQSQGSRRAKDLASQGRKVRVRRTLRANGRQASNHFLPLVDHDFLAFQLSLDLREVVVDR